MKKIISILLACALLLSLVACSGGASQSSEVSSSASESESVDESSESESESESEAVEPVHELPEEDVLLRVGLHHFKWSVNEEPTEEAPNVFNSSRYITDSYIQMYPNVTVEPYDMTFNDPTELLEALTILVAGGTASDILFTWGNSMQDQNWYYDLTDAMSSPNWYEDGQPIWMDMYPSYIWDGTYNCSATDGRIVSVPVCFNAPGTAGVFCNLNLFNEMGLSTPTSFQEFIDDCQTFKDAGYVAYAPSLWASTCDTGTWDWWAFIIPSFTTPEYNTYLDPDGDGAATTIELFQAWAEGHFYIQNNTPIQNMFKTFKYMHSVIKEPGVENIDYAQPWVEGNLAMVQDGLWRSASEASNTERDFEYTTILAPLVKAGTTFELDGEQVSLTENDVFNFDWTEAGPEKLTALECQYNVFDPTVQDRPEANALYAIDYLKYFTSTENLSMVIEEQGSFIGATKTCQVPPIMVDWMAQPFPMNSEQVGQANPCTSWSTAFDASAKNAMLQEYVFSMTDFDSFAKEWDAKVYNDILTYAEQEGIDMSEWDVYVPEGVEA